MSEETEAVVQEVKEEGKPLAAGSEPLDSRVESFPANSAVESVLFPYGVGVDTHSKFIAVCVLVQRKRQEHGRKPLASSSKPEDSSSKPLAAISDVVRYEKSFRTFWPDLLAAKAWVDDLLEGVERPDQTRYCIESTGTYHLPVIRAWQGRPCVVNPLLAGPTRRKTDVLVS